MSTYVTFIEPLVEPGANSVELTKRVGEFLAPARAPAQFNGIKAWIASASPEDAHQTGIQFLKRVADYNHSRPDARQQLDFRLGTAPGPNEAMALVDALELAQNSPAGTVSIHKQLYTALSPEAQCLYELATAQSEEYRSLRVDLPECFIIMPMAAKESEIGKRREEVYRRYIVPACIKLRATPVRPDRQSGHSILSDVIGVLNVGEFVIAYLGGEPWNANTMIEVGYRWATGRPMVLLAENTLPFDLHDHRSVILDCEKEGQPGYVEQKTQEIFDHMRVRHSTNDRGELHATATVVIDERETVAPEKRHAISMASDATAELFDIPRERLIGMHPEDVIQRLRELMGDPLHFEQFGADQQELYTKLSPATPYNPGAPPERAVYAKVPMIFRKHPKADYNMRAFLPIIVSYIRGREVSRQNVLYLDVTNAVRCTTEGYVCTLPQPNPMLVFKAYANGYDRVLLNLPTYREVLERHVRKIAPRAGMRLLDLGAGTGNLTLALLEAGAHVTAVDNNAAMLRELRRKMAGYDETLEIVEQDACNLSPWRDGAFEAVSIGLVLFSIVDPQDARTALREAMRVLSPGGVLVVTEPRRSFKMRELLEQTRQHLEQDSPLWEKLRPDWDTIVSANETITPEGRETVNADEVERTCKDRGYSVSRAEAYWGHCATIVAKKPAAGVAATH